MSKSELVTYEKVSSYKSTRNHIIDTITPHCIVGQWTAERGVNYFYDLAASNSTKQASCNYVVGKDGSIGLCVPEEYRAWTSSSQSNDDRAVTIEVASDTTHPYAITNDALDALTKLMTDIAYRNGIKSLLWKADKNLIGQVDKQNITVHRWFANKPCPGDYIYNLLPTIADNCNKELAKLYNARWEKNGTKYSYYIGDKPVTGWKLINRHWYLFDDNGIMLTGWQKSDGKWVYLHDIVGSDLEGALYRSDEYGYQDIWTV